MASSLGDKGKVYPMYKENKGGGEFRKIGNQNISNRLLHVYNQLFRV